MSYAENVGFNGVACGKVFESIGQGKTLVECCILHSLTDDVVHEIFRRYALASKSFFIEGKHIEAINELDLDGPFPIESGEDLLAVMMIAANPPKCEQCQKRARTYCKGCVTASIRSAIEATVAQLTQEPEPAGELPVTAAAAVSVERVSNDVVDEIDRVPT